MKNLLLFLFLISSYFAQAQVSIYSAPVFSGNPDSGFVPISSRTGNIVYIYKQPLSRIGKAYTDSVAASLQTALKLNISDTSSMLTPYLKSSVATASYFPLSGGTLMGTGGNGFVGFVPQSVTPTAPLTGFRIFASNAGAFAWLTNQGYTRELRIRNQNQDFIGYFQNKVSYTLADSADVANIAANTIATFDFIIGDGGSNTPIAGTTSYTNAALKGKSITSFKQAGIQLPLTPITGSAYATFDSSNGSITLHNSVFSNGSYYSVTTAGTGTFSATASSTISPYLVYSTLFAGSLAPLSTSALAVTNVRQQLLSTDWNDDVRPAYVRFIGNFGLGIISNDVVELRVNDVTNFITFSSATATVPYLFGTSSTNDPNVSVKVSTPWIAIPSSRIYITFAAYNQTASRGSLTNLRMEVKYQ